MPYMPFSSLHTKVDTSLARMLEGFTLLDGLVGGPNLCIGALWQQGKSVLSTHAQHAGETYKHFQITSRNERVCSEVS